MSYKAAEEYRAGLDDLETAQYYFLLGCSKIKDQISAEEEMHLCNLRITIAQARVRLTAATPEVDLKSQLSNLKPQISKLKGAGQ